MLLGEDPSAASRGRSSDPPGDSAPFLTAGEGGEVTPAGVLVPGASPRGLTLEGDRDREEGMFFGPACSPDRADRTLLAAETWGPALFTAGRTSGCRALRDTWLIRLSSVWAS